MNRLPMAIVLPMQMGKQRKAENPMLWVGRMNEIQARAREIVQAELIFVYNNQAVGDFDFLPLLIERKHISIFFFKKV